MRLNIDMKIGINTLALPKKKTGGGKYISGLVRYLDSMDTGETRFVIFVNKDNKSEFKECRNKNFLFYDCGFIARIRPLRIAWEQLVLPFVVAKEKVDILHSPGFVAPLFLPKRCKSFLTIFDMTFFLFPEKHILWKRMYFNRLIPVCVGRSAKIFTISENSKKDIVNYFRIPEEKVIVTYLGIEEGFGPKDDEEKLEVIRKRYNLPGRFILYLGVLEPRKNLVSLVKSYWDLKHNFGIEEKLVIAGKKGWGYEEVYVEVEKLKLEAEILFLDYIPEDDLPYVYNLATLLVYPSIYEGFGIPILEAMACGVPVITSNVSSMPEVAGDAAILVEPDNVVGFSNAVLRILGEEELRDSLVEKGFQRSKIFSWGNAAKATFAEYKN